jgi:hypothetical protein
MFGYENRETMNTEILKCWSHLFRSRILEICVCQGLDTETREVSNPENPEVRDPPSLFLHFRGLYRWLFGHLPLQNPKI